MGYTISERRCVIVVIVKNRLKDLRTERRLTIRELAEKLNIPNYSELYKFEVSKRNWSMDKIIPICDYFKISLDYLFYRSDLKQMAHQIPTMSYESQTEKDILMSLKRISDESTLEIIKGVIEVVSGGNSSNTKTIIDTHEKENKKGDGTIV